MAGRQQAELSPAGLKVCGNAEGFRARQQETTQNSGLGLSPPPPCGPSSSSVSSFSTPPSSQICVFHFSPPLLVVGSPDPTPQPTLPCLFWGCCLNRLMVRQGQKGQQESPRTTSHFFREELRPGGDEGLSKCLNFMTSDLYKPSLTLGNAEKGRAVQRGCICDKGKAGTRLCTDKRSCHWWHHC